MYLVLDISAKSTFKHIHKTDWSLLSCACLKQMPINVPVDLFLSIISVIGSFVSSVFSVKENNVFIEE